MKRIAILPIDGYPTAKELFAAFDKLFAFPWIKELVAYVKLNDGVHNPDMGGPAIVEAMQNRLKEIGLPIKFFLDLKVYDVSATLLNVLKKYKEHDLGILTVCSSCSVEGIMKLRELLPETKLAMVSVPTDISKEECIYRFGASPYQKISSDLGTIRGWYEKMGGKSINAEPFDLVVCSKDEVIEFKGHYPDKADFPFGFIVPGIRDEWMKKKDEHQKRVTGVREVLEIYPDILVVMGAQLTKGNQEIGVSAEESGRRTAIEIANVKWPVL